MSLLASLIPGLIPQKKPSHAEEHNHRDAKSTGVPATDEFYLGLLKNGPLTSPEIARRADRAPGIATQKMYRLERKGLVQRDPNFKRGRHHPITWSLV